MNVLRSHDYQASETPLGLLTLLEAASALRCSKAHLYRIISGRRFSGPPLPVFRIGRKTFIRQTQLEAWIRSLEDIARENSYGSGFFGRRPI